MKNGKKYNLFCGYSVIGNTPVFHTGEYEFDSRYPLLPSWRNWQRNAPVMRGLGVQVPLTAYKL